MVNALLIAQQFHEVYESLAPSFGYETRTDTKQFNANTQNGQLMIAVCQRVGDAIEKAAFTAGFEAGCRERNNCN